MHPTCVFSIIDLFQNWKGMFGEEEENYQNNMRISQCEIVTHLAISGCVVLLTQKKDIYLGIILGDEKEKLDKKNQRKPVRSSINNSKLSSRSSSVSLYSKNNTA